MIPLATYRLQFNKNFRFSDAEALVGYFSDLGISHIYASPLLKSRADSLHGYDGVDPTSLDPEIGTEDEFRSLADALHARGMSIVLDIVPNHMAADVQNPWWLDVLERGVESPYAGYFDIDWKAGGNKVRQTNYRRFFDVYELVSLRQENPEVFARTHELPLRLIKQGLVAGLRVDHVDGLLDPAAYLRNLRQSSDETSPTYLIVEKILGSGEELPNDWPLDGTTGYEFLVRLNGLFVDPPGLEKLTLTHAAFIGDERAFEDVAYESKRRVMDELFPGEMHSLSEQFASLALDDAAASRIAAEALRKALVTVTACLPVYRTYTSSRGVRDADRKVIERAVEVAAKHHTALDPPALDFVRRVLSLDRAPVGVEWLEFVMRWQQYTSPIAAKGIEDTAFYRYSALISANEVGGDPSQPTTSSERFHEANAITTRIASLNTTSTHDTKFSEDARARLNVLSEIASEWAGAANRWREMNASKKSLVHCISAPTQRDEYRIYQLLVGAWPLQDGEVPEFRERLHGVLTKSLREAKLQTSHLQPDDEYESAAHRFVDALFVDESFVADLGRLLDRVLVPGAINSLAQVLLKITSPGVPDVYQGNELWDFSLVDPDNRRPVDFAQRQQLRRDVDEATPTELLETWRDGRVKLHVLSRSLQFRRKHPELFEQGEYIPLTVEGERASHVIAFARRWREEWAITLVPRLTVGLGHSWPLGPVWRGTRVILPEEAPSAWVNVLEVVDIRSDGSILTSDALSLLPIALLRSNR